MLTYNPDTPILLIAFTRNETTRKVFEKIHKVRPRRFYFAVDGPRNEKEVVMCRQVKDIVTGVDWNCEVKTLFRETNLGCRKGVSEAVTWFFENEPEGIILEDDCFAADSFFGFCSKLLEKYRHDERIGHISGGNYQNGTKRGDGSYYFSALTHVWGWAGWRRVWKDFDIEVSTYPLLEKFNYLEKLGSHGPFKHYWTHKFKTHYENQSLNTWGFQYSYLNLINSRLSIIPNTNLITNIGCDSINAAHIAPDHPWGNIPLGDINEIVHPSFIIADHEADFASQNGELSIPDYEENFKSGFSFLKDKIVRTAEALRKNDEVLKIPKIIHQAWIYSDELPALFKTIAESWQECHSGWEYRLWCRSDAENFVRENYPDFLPIYNGYEHDAERRNAIRYLLLHKTGGVYVNIDYECLESVDLLLGNSSCCIGLHSPSVSIYHNKPFLLNHDFMASTAGHNYMKMVIDEMIGDNNKPTNEHPVFHLGSFLMTKIYDKYPDKDDISLIPSELISPLSEAESKAIFDGMETSELENKVEKAFALNYYKYL